MIYLGIVTHNVLSICTRVMAFDLHQNFFFCTRVMALDLRRNFYSAQYLEVLDIFSPNLIYAFIWTRSSMGLLQVILRKFVPELWPFINAKILFQFNFSRTNW